MLGLAGIVGQRCLVMVRAVRSKIHARRPATKFFDAWHPTDDSDDAAEPQTNVAGFARIQRHRLNFCESSYETRARKQHFAE
jgi:hypothetical protein